MGQLERWKTDAAETPSGIEINDDGIVIGRGRRVDVRVSGGTISREHARVFRRKGRDYLQDLGSRNGTVIGNRRLFDETVRLSDRDIIEVGTTRFTYRKKSSKSPSDGTTIDSSDASTANNAALGGVVGGAERVAMSASKPPNPRRFALGEGRAWTGNERWTRVELIGRGGMGEVYRAFDVDLDETVAVKRLRSRIEDSEILERIHQREASIARAMRHPNLVRVLEDGLIEERPFLLLEWVDGPPLDVALRTEQFDFAARLEILRQVALGLAAAHNAGVVHSDLKPANILIVDYETKSRRETANEILESSTSELDADLDSGDHGVKDRRIEDSGLVAEVQNRIDASDGPDFEQAPAVAREGEIQQLMQLARDSDGPATWILLCGERCVGKRRLVQALKDRVRDRGEAIDVELDESGDPPVDGATGLWISLFPAELPDDVEWHSTRKEVEEKRPVHEVFVKPLLRGQQVRFIEAFCRHTPSARAFVDQVESDRSGHVEVLLAEFRKSFELGAWRPRGKSFRFEPPRLEAGRRERIQKLMLQFDGLEQGVRDLLIAASPIGRGMAFELLVELSGKPADATYYLVGAAQREGFLVEGPPRTYRFQDEFLRQAIESRLDEKARRRLLKRAAPLLRALTSVDPEPELRLRLAEVERLLGRADRAFGHFLLAARESRARYQREVFFQCLDGARAIYQQAGTKKSALKPLRQQLRATLRLDEAGISAIDRFRRLPMNVRARLTDFGIARRVVEIEAEEAIESWGTPRYMSPEQARQTTYGPPSDIYSLGIVAREILEGSHPLGTLRGRVAVDRIAHEGVPLPREGKHGPLLTPLIALMLDPDPARRPDARTVADTIERYQLGLSIDSYG